jgi:hypothetical protein
MMPLRRRPKYLPKHIYAKIKADSAPESVLNGLLEACARVPSEGDIENAIDAYCVGKELCGPNVTLDANERLGHVKPEARTVGRIANELSMDPLVVGQLLEALAGEGSSTDIDLAENWFENEIVNGPGQNITIAQRPTWLFRAEDRVGDPFDGDCACLPWRLASTSFVGESRERNH